MTRIRGALSGAMLLLAFGASAAFAQEKQLEVHGNYVRTTQSHANSWGGGAQYGITWGSTQQSIQLSTSLGADWVQQENSGPNSTSVGLDANLQPGGGGSFTPYVGASISANWVSENAPDGALLGLEYMAGAYYKLEAQGPISLHAEVRSGYVRTQEHQITGRLGVAFSL